MQIMSYFMADWALDAPMRYLGGCGGNSIPQAATASTLRQDAQVPFLIRVFISLIFVSKITITITVPYYIDHGRHAYR